MFLYLFASLQFIPRRPSIDYGDICSFPFASLLDLTSGPDIGSLRGRFIFGQFLLFSFSPFTHVVSWTLLIWNRQCYEHFLYESISTSTHQFEMSLWWDKKVRFLLCETLCRQVLVDILSRNSLRGLLFVLALQATIRHVLLSVGLFSYREDEVGLDGSRIVETCVQFLL